MCKIVIVAGARPNFMKVAPIIKACEAFPALEPVLVHTGQHYDDTMSKVFFAELDMPEPHIHLNVGSGFHAAQTAHIMLAFEREVLPLDPDMVLVVGDVNSTVACALVASKCGIALAHVEAGLRSFDRSMPEEINRIVTDSISDYLFVTEPSGIKNLKKEGVSDDRMFFVGNVMIDTLLANMEKIERSAVLNRLFPSHTNGNKSSIPPYAVLTLHRGANVDSREALCEIHTIIGDVAYHIPVIYPAHPRTVQMLKKHGLYERFSALDNVTMIEPLGYLDFIKLVKHAACVLTDSGGIQEETTVLGVPCLTMRENTERPLTMLVGTNKLVGRNRKKIDQEMQNILRGENMQSEAPYFWDGHSAERIASVLHARLSRQDECFSTRGYCNIDMICRGVTA